MTVQMWHGSSSWRAGLNRCSSRSSPAIRAPSSSRSDKNMRSITFSIIDRRRQAIVIEKNTLRASAGSDDGFGGHGGGNPPPLGGDGGNWDDGGDESRKQFDFKSFFVGLLLLGTPSCVLVAYTKRKGAKQLEAGYDMDPVHSLKRLVRELFEKDVETQERLSLLEEKLGVVHEGSPGLNASKVLSQSSSKTGQSAVHHGEAHRAIGGRLTLGGGLLWSNDAETSNLDAMVDSGVQLGTHLTLQSRGQFRRGKDFILTDINIDGASQEEFNLQKVLYSCGLSERIKIMFSPFGARGNDVTYTLNPFAGRGLTAATSEGNPLLHDRGRGSMIGSTISMPRSWMTAAVFRNESDENAEKALLQVILAPTRHLSVGMSVLEAQGPGSRLREYANTLLNSIIQRPAASNTPNIDRSAMEIAGNFALSVGNNFAVHGWAASDSVGSLFNAQPTTMTWNISFGDKIQVVSNTNTILPRWVASVGKSSVPNRTTRDALTPDIFEFSTEFDLGNGLSCHPGMVAVRDTASTWTILAGAKTVWDF